MTSREIHRSLSPCEDPWLFAARSTTFLHFTCYIRFSTEDCRTNEDVFRTFAKEALKHLDRELGDDPYDLRFWSYDDGTGEADACV
jgi:hypothetical protein